MKQNKKMPESLEKEFAEHSKDFRNKFFPESELAEWLIKSKRSVFLEADIDFESKKKILNNLGYSTNMLYQ